MKSTKLFSKLHSSKTVKHSLIPQKVSSEEEHDNIESNNNETNNCSNNTSFEKEENIIIVTSENNLSQSESDNQNQNQNQNQNNNSESTGNTIKNQIFEKVASGDTLFGKMNLDNKIFSLDDDDNDELNERGIDVDGVIMSPNDPDIHDFANDEIHNPWLGASTNISKNERMITGTTMTTKIDSSNKNENNDNKIDNKDINMSIEMQEHLENQNGKLKMKKGKNGEKDRALMMDTDSNTIDSETGMTGNGDKGECEFKCVSWNLWCIPVASPRTLSNPERCGQFVRELAEREKWNEFDGLIFFGVQELWGWKTGIFPPFILRIVALLEYIPYIGRCISAVFQTVSLLIGVLPLLKCLPIKYCPKQRFYNRVKHILPHALYKTSVPVKCFLDSGLLLLSNVPPKKWGFESFEECTCDDSMADKGFLYAYYESQKLMVINTHLQAAGQGKERILQLKQLRRFVDHWRQRAKFDRICILGDFNSDMSSHEERVRIFLEQQQMIVVPQSDENSQEKKEDNSLNHDSNDDNENENENEDSLQISPCESEKNRMHEVPKSGVHIDIQKVDARKASPNTLNQVELQMQDQHKWEEDPLSTMSYTELPKNLVPPEAREVRGHKTQLIKKGYINIPYHLGPKFIKVNTFEQTYKRANFNIDHIFINFDYELVSNSMYATKNGMYSDHKLVCTQFKQTNTMLNNLIN